MRALSRHVVRQFNPDRKETESGSRKGTNRHEPAGALGLLSRLTADLNSSCSPTVACHDAMRNQATTGSFRIVAAEAGGVAATGAEAARAAASGHHGRLNQADNRQCEQGYDRFPHPRSTPICHPRGIQHFRGGIIRRPTSFAGKLAVSRRWPGRLPLSGQIVERGSSFSSSDRLR